MSLALLGLVAFQWIWITSAIESNEERFNRDVNEALHAVSEKLERQEALYALSQNLPLLKSHTPSMQMPYGANSFFFDSTLSEGIDITLQFQSEGGRGSFRISAVDPRAQYQSNMRRMEDQLQKAMKKSEMLFQALENMLSPDRSPLTRFRPKQLDSLIQSELNERGISIDYDYAVVNPKRGQVLLASNRQADAGLLQSDFRATLFSNDVVGDPSWLVVDFPGSGGYLRQKIIFPLASSALLLLAIMGVFAYSVRTIVRQKQLSEMKTDFINNMTHELKTPIATISLASEALSDEEINKAPGLQQRYLKMIGEENRRLGEQVERVLQMAAMDRKEIQLKREPLDLRHLVYEAREKTLLQVESRQGSIKIIDNASTSSIFADRTHITNILVNLLENANKYSPETPDITVRIFNLDGKVQVSVQDRGIGMSRDVQQHIFDKFYRVPTGNVHNVKGFGLGLTYVKNMIGLHDGQVKVQSEPNKGSKFTIILPINYDLR